MRMYSAERSLRDSRGWGAGVPVLSLSYVYMPGRAGRGPGGLFGSCTPLHVNQRGPSASAYLFFWGTLRGRVMGGLGNGSHIGRGVVSSCLTSDPDPPRPLFRIPSLCASRAFPTFEFEGAR